MECDSDRYTRADGKQGVRFSDVIYGLGAVAILSGLSYAATIMYKHDTSKQISEELPWDYYDTNKFQANESR